MIGSFLYAFASMVLSIAVVQLAGEDAGGVFTFAFTTFGQHMFMAAYFGIRPFQITDILILQHFKGSVHIFLISRSDCGTIFTRFLTHFIYASRSSSRFLIL